MKLEFASTCIEKFINSMQKLQVAVKNKDEKNLAKLRKDFDTSKKQLIDLAKDLKEAGRKEFLGKEQFHSQADSGKSLTCPPSKNLSQDQILQNSYQEETVKHIQEEIDQLKLLNAKLVEDNEHLKSTLESQKKTNEVNIINQLGEASENYENLLKEYKKTLTVYEQSEVSLKKSNKDLEGIIKAKNKENEQLIKKINQKEQEMKEMIMENKKEIGKTIQFIEAGMTEKYLGIETLAINQLNKLDDLKEDFGEAKLKIDCAFEKEKERLEKAKKLFAVTHKNLTLTSIIEKCKNMNIRIEQLQRIVKAAVNSECNYINQTRTKDLLIIELSQTLQLYKNDRRNLLNLGSDLESLFIKNCTSFNEKIKLQIENDQKRLININNSINTLKEKFNMSKDCNLKLSQENDEISKKLENLLSNSLITGDEHNQRIKVLMSEKEKLIKICKEFYLSKSKKGCFEVLAKSSANVMSKIETLKSKLDKIKECSEKTKFKIANLTEENIKLKQTIITNKEQQTKAIKDIEGYFSNLTKSMNAVIFKKSTITRIDQMKDKIIYIKSNLIEKDTNYQSKLQGIDRKLLDILHVFTGDSKALLCNIKQTFPLLSINLSSLIKDQFSNIVKRHQEIQNKNMEKIQKPIKKLLKQFYNSNVEKFECLRQIVFEKANNFLTGEFISEKLYSTIRKLIEEKNYNKANLEKIKLIIQSSKKLFNKVKCSLEQENKEFHIRIPKISECFIKQNVQLQSLENSKKKLQEDLSIFLKEKREANEKLANKINSLRNTALKINKEFLSIKEQYNENVFDLATKMCEHNKIFDEMKGITMQKIKEKIDIKQSDENPDEEIIECKGRRGDKLEEPEKVENEEMKQALVENIIISLKKKFELHKTFQIEMKKEIHGLLIEYKGKIAEFINKFTENCKLLENGQKEKERKIISLELEKASLSEIIKQRERAIEEFRAHNQNEIIKVKTQLEQYQHSINEKQNDTINVITTLLEKKHEQARIITENTKTSVQSLVSKILALQEKLVLQGNLAINSEKCLKDKLEQKEQQIIYLKNARQNVLTIVKNWIDITKKQNKERQIDILQILKGYYKEAQNTFKQNTIKLISQKNNAKSLLVVQQNTIKSLEEKLLKQQKENTQEKLASSIKKLIKPFTLLKQQITTMKKEYSNRIYELTEILTKQYTQLIPKYIKKLKTKLNKEIEEKAPQIKKLKEFERNNEELVNKTKFSDKVIKKLGDELSDAQSSNENYKKKNNLINAENEKLKRNIEAIKETFKSKIIKGILNSVKENKIQLEYIHIKIKEILQNYASQMQSLFVDSSLGYKKLIESRTEKLSKYKEEIKEKIIKLTHENKDLKAKASQNKNDNESNEKSSLKELQQKLSIKDEEIKISKEQYKEVARLNAELSNQINILQQISKEEKKETIINMPGQTKITQDVQEDPRHKVPASGEIVERKLSNSSVNTCPVFHKEIMKKASNPDPLLMETIKRNFIQCIRFMPSKYKKC